MKNVAFRELWLYLILLPSLMLCPVSMQAQTNKAQQNNAQNNNQLLPTLPTAQQCIILIHGITANTQYVALIEKNLNDNGYYVANIGWETGGKLEPISDNIFNEGLEICRSISDIKRIHLIGHSTGGLIIRYHLANNIIPELGYVVMIGTPNKGSKLANLAKFTMSEDKHNAIYGETIRYLHVGDDAFHTTLPDASGYYLGVIAGTGHESLKDRIYALVEPGIDDGRVSLTSAMIEGMNDFIIFPHQHNRLTEQDDVHQQIIAFLQSGSFDHRH
ncbi:MAG: putative lipase [Alphaproteobacteria bacterium]|nr:putative lipase [Alphaproteobacteria bacterium]